MKIMITAHESIQDLRIFKGKSMYFVLTQSTRTFVLIYVDDKH